MLTVFLARHGETAASRDNQFCGALDIPLNQVGHAMAEALAASYSDMPWAALYVSPKLRARQTIEPLARRTGLEPQILEGLREIEYGAWEGMLETEVARTDPEGFSAWTKNPGRVAPPGGETGQKVAERALLALDEIRSRHADGQVLAVTHKATIRVLVCALLGIDVNLFRARIAQPVGAVTIFELRPTGPLLRRLGDNCHLPAALRQDA